MIKDSGYWGDLDGEGAYVTLVGAPPDPEVAGLAPLSAPGVLAGPVLLPSVRVHTVAHQQYSVVSRLRTGRLKVFLVNLTDFKATVFCIKGKKKKRGKIKTS